MTRHSSRITHHPSHIIFALILLLAAALRFYHLDASSLWSDEGNTWAMMERSFGAIAQAAAQDIHPPGYYWALKLWTILFGTSAFALRSFSAVAGVLLVLVIAQLGRQVFRRRTDARWLALLAALLAAVNPFQIYYSQEARMYMPLALAAAGLFWALFALWHTQRLPHQDWPWWRPSWPEIGFFACGVAGMWTHYSFPIVLAAAGIAYGVRWAAMAMRQRRSTAGDASPVAPDHGERRSTAALTHEARWNRAEAADTPGELVRFLVLNGLILVCISALAADRAAKRAPLAQGRCCHWPGRRADPDPADAALWAAA